MSDPVISVQDLRIGFPTSEGVFHAVDGITFDIHAGEIMALVGESGSGKSMTSLAIMGLLPRGADLSGTVRINGAPLPTGPGARDKRALQDLRGACMGMIFQEPMTSLNPVLSIQRQLTEGLLRHSDVSRATAYDIALSALADVGIPDPQRLMRQFPHQLSGGMRQRVMIAAALTLEPDLLIADEPTTALDVTVQAQVLDLLVSLKQRRRAGILLITHDIGVVAETADRVAVMQHGKIVESGPVADIIFRPTHPYTQKLLSAHLTLESAHPFDASEAPDV
jgi:ABC-type dipeptide/oligopeptide/nickel transport system ATPase component